MAFGAPQNHDNVDLNAEAPASLMSQCLPAQPTDKIQMNNGLDTIIEDDEGNETAQHIDEFAQK